MKTLLGALLSKSIWFAVLNAALVAASPVVEQWVVSNPTKYAGIISAAILLLRTVTTKSLAEKA